MPENAIYVGRPTRWGNDFGAPVIALGLSGRFVRRRSPFSREEAVELYRYTLAGRSTRYLQAFLAPLLGKDLACRCPLDRPCHADVLLELLATVAA